MELSNLKSYSQKLGKRVLSAIILAPLCLIIVWLGGPIYNAVAVLLAVLMAFEWASIIGYTQDEEPSKTKQRWFAAGVAYASIFGASMIYIRSLDQGLGIILYLLMVVWLTDIFAYFSGKLIGGPKLLPKISPNKTYAGLAGGMVAAGVASMLASAVIDPNNMGWMFMLGAALAFVAQAGDYFESWVKRTYSVKDSGNILPGHGGIMDRVDGLVSVGLLFTIVLIFLGGAI